LVKGTLKLTHYAEDAEECPTTNKMGHVLPADIQLLEPEDVIFYLYR